MTKNEFLAAALRNPVDEAIVEELFRLALPDAWIVSGCLAQSVWNGLTNRAVDHGINDYDVYAPDGFDDLANMIVRPNPGANFSAANYEKKAERWKKLWSEITVLPADITP